MTKERSLPALVVLLAGCATATPTVTTPLYQPTFDYSPPTFAVPGDSELTVALLSPSYPDDAMWAEFAPGLADDLARDLEESLTARGFRVMGPFGTYDEMVYQEKENSHLLLTPAMELDATVHDVVPKEHHIIELLGPSRGNFTVESGSVTVGGRVTISILESFTQEKLFSRSIELPSSTSAFTGELEYTAPPPPVSHNEPVLRNAVSRALEGLYVQILGEVWDQLDPRQMEVLQGQAMEIREKAGYTRGR